MNDKNKQKTHMLVMEKISDLIHCVYL